MNIHKIKSIVSSSFLKHSWENDSNNIFDDYKITFTLEDKRIIKYLLLSEGISDINRRKLWFIASGAMKELIDNPGYYYQLTVNYPNKFPSPYEYQINLDLKRTYPEDPFFKDKNNLERLKKILLAYSRRNLSIGYCQGFNFIAGRLLKYLNDEEEAFWVFTQLMEDILPINYYTELVGIMVDCTILNSFLKCYIPDLFSHLIKNGFELNLNNFIYKWFVSIFIQNFSDDISLCIWDFLFLEGSIIMFKSALAIFVSIKKPILKTNEFEEIYNILGNGTNEIKDKSILLYYLSLRNFEFDMNFIEKHRKSFQKPIIENIIKENISCKDKISRKSQISICNTEWPICMNDKKTKISLDLLIYRCSESPKIYENYFFKKAKNGFKIAPSSYGEIICERKIHTCVEIVSEEEKIDDIIISDSLQEDTFFSDTEDDFSFLYKTIKNNTEYKNAKNVLSSFVPIPLNENDSIILN